MTHSPTHGVWLVMVSSALLIALLAAAPADGDRILVNLSYYGRNVTRPGLLVGADFVLAEKRRRLGRVHGLVVGPNLGGYYHPGNQGALFGLAMLGYRLTLKKGFRFDVQVGAGYARTFLPGRTYQVGDAGEVERLRGAGTNQFMGTFALGFGHDLPQRRQRTIGAYFGHFGVSGQAPHNGSMLPTLYVAAGVGFGIPGRRRHG